MDAPIDFQHPDPRMRKTLFSLWNYLDAKATATIKYLLTSYSSSELPHTQNYGQFDILNTFRILNKQKKSITLNDLKKAILPFNTPSLARAIADNAADKNTPVIEWMVRKNPEQIDFVESLIDWPLTVLDEINGFKSAFIEMIMLFIKHVDNGKLAMWFILVCNPEDEIDNLHELLAVDTIESKFRLIELCSGIMKNNRKPLRLLIELISHGARSALEPFEKWVIENRKNITQQIEQQFP